MKKFMQNNIYYLPLFLWIVIIPVVVKVKFFTNPLTEFSWYSNEVYLADFFLYHKSMLITLCGAVMIMMLGWMIGKMRNKNGLFNKNTYIFIPLIVYIALVIISSMFSEYKYFSGHGMPDQFETVWNVIAYVVAVFYCYYLVVYQDAEISILKLIFAGATLVSIICVLQYFKLDIYRLIYAGDGYSFTFAPGQVYGPFYNVNYVGSYVLLVIPIFIMLAALHSDLKVKIASAILAVGLLICMLGACSSSAWVAFGVICFFVIIFMLLKLAKTHKILYFPLLLAFFCTFAAVFAIHPKINSYIQNADTAKTDLEHIYTLDDEVEIDYKGNQLFIQMFNSDSVVTFSLTDQDKNAVNYEYCLTDDGYYYYAITDDRFKNFQLTPTIIDQDPVQYGFIVKIDEKEWCFIKDVASDGGYYFYTALGKLTKLTEENDSPNFHPLVSLSGLANGRGYIWNKSIAMLKKYIVFGSGADTYAIVYPNDDFVDKYNNGYDNLIITKPHNLYLQIGVQSGVISLICFLVFYVWYFINSSKLYFRVKFKDVSAILGFSIFLGTIGYMITGLANDSTVTVSPIFWALIGVGIGINYKLKNEQS